MAVSVIPGKPVAYHGRPRRPVVDPDGIVHESVHAAARAARRPSAKIWEFANTERRGYRFATAEEAIEAGFPPFPVRG